MRKVWAVAHEIKRKGESGNGQVGGDEWVHALAFSVTGVESLREMSVQQGKRLIDALERVASRRPNLGYRAFGFAVDDEGRLVVTISPAQAAKLRAEAGKIGWDDRQVCTVASRQLGRSVSGLRAIRADEARRVMGLLEAIVEDRTRRQRQMDFVQDAKTGTVPRSADVGLGAVQSPFSGEEE